MSARFWVATVWGGWAAAAFAGSITINVDFKSEPVPGGEPLPTYVGTAAAPDLGTVWNGLDRLGAGAGFGSGLVDSLGTPTSVTVRYPGPPGGALLYDVPGPYSNLLGDMLMASTQDPAPFSIHGLPANTRYRLYTYGTWSEPGLGTEFAIADSDQNSLHTLNDGTVEQLVEGVNYVVFTGLTSHAGGIHGTYGRLPGHAQGLFNGFQVTVPEPSGVAWLAFAPMLRRRG
jgi:hypothetical protein